MPEADSAVEKTSGGQGATSSPAPVSARAAAPNPTSTSLSRDWTDEVTDKIEDLVGTVRNKTTVPAVKAARGAVFGTLIAAAGLAALVLFVIALIRLVDVYLPFHPEARRVWLTYAGLGAIFVLAGAFLWTKRKPRRK